MAEPEHRSSARFMTAYLKQLLRFRWLVLIVVLVVSVLAALTISRAVIASSVGKMFLGESAKYKRYLKLTRQFGDEEALFIGIEDPDFLTSAGQKRLKDTVDSLKALPFVAKVRSLREAQGPRLDGQPGVCHYFQEAAKDPRQIEAIREALRHSALYRGVFVSEDGRSTAIIVELTQNKERTAEETPQIVRQVRETVTKVGYKPGDIHLTGLIVLMAEIMTETSHNVNRIFPFASLFLLLAVWVLFGRLWPAAVSLAVALISTLWTVGFAVLLDREVNVMISSAIIVVLIVSFSDVIHLCSAYLLELEEGKEQEEAILAAGVDVGRACIYTSLTTFIGFIGLCFVPTPVFRLLGMVYGFGVFCALVLALTFVPVLFSFLPVPKVTPGTKDGLVDDWMGRFLRLCERVSLGRPKLMVGIFAVIFGLMLVGGSQVHIETDLAKRLAPRNIVRKDQDWFRSKFGGVNVIDLYVTLPGKKALADPEMLARLKTYQARLTEQDSVDSARSLLDLMEIAQGALKGRVELPKSRGDAMASLGLLFQTAGPELKRIVDVDKGLVRIMLRTKVSGFRGTTRAGEAAKALGVSLLGSTVTIESTGLIFILGDWLDEVVLGQKRGLLISIVVIAFMMVFCVRSLKIGLWSMVPNIFPLLAVGSYVGVFWDQVDSDTLSVALLAIGIGVDDTIHFLTRYRLEAERCATQEEAVRNSYHFAGRAILMTTLIFVAGSLPFITSDYFSVTIFGTLLPFCLMVAVLADLLLVPAMVMVGLIRFPLGGEQKILEVASVEGTLS